MTVYIVLANSLLAVALVLALAREMRLRRALQRLLAKLLTLWRNPHASTSNPPSDADGRPADRSRVR